MKTYHAHLIRLVAKEYGVSRAQILESLSLGNERLSIRLDERRREYAESMQQARKVA